MARGIVLPIIIFSLILCTVYGYAQENVTLTVRSRYGSPDPSVGNHICPINTEITASVATPVAGTPGIRYVCTGYRARGSPETLPPTGGGNSVTFTITMNTTLTWTWKTQYLLTATASPEGSGTIDISPTSPDGYYDAKSTVTLTASDNTGYDFGYWSGGLRGITNPQNLLLRGPRNVVATFILEKRYFTVISAYGEPVPPVGTYDYYYGDTVDANCGPNPYPGETGTQYVCTGHSGTGTLTDGSQTIVSFIIYDDSSVTWTWQTQYYLTIDSLYGDPVGAGWYDAGATANWSVTSPYPGGTGIRYAASPASGDVLMDSPKTVTVSWTTQYCLTYNSPRGGLVEEGWYDAGTTANWYAISPWYYGDEPGIRYIADPASGSILMDAPQTITVKWSTEYYLTIDSPYGDPAGEDWYDVGVTAYWGVISPWPGEPGVRYVTSPTFGSIVMDGPKTVTVLWNTQYCLTYNSPLGEPVEEGWYDSGTTANWSVTSPWPGDPGVRYIGSPTSGSTLMDGPKSVTITWTTQYYLTIEPPDIGDPQGAGWCDAGTEASWSVTSPWPTGTGVRRVTDTTSGAVLMDAPKTLVVSWITQYQLTAAANPSAGGSVSPPSGSWHNAGTVISCLATPSPGYTFASWSGNLTGTANPQNLTMDSPKSVTANFLFADFTGTPTAGNVPLTVVFTDASTGNITSWSWNFGSGASPATTNTQGPHSVTYSTVGLKTVSLTVTGSSGSDTETKLDYINVWPPVPATNFSATPRSAVAAPLTVQFTDESTSVITSWQWDFDNNGTVDSVEQNPSYTYTGTGRYTVKLTVTGPGGTDDEIKTDYIRVCTGTIYVKTDGNDGNDGSSWALAKKTIQAGINAASTDWAVRVANGTYSTDGDRNLDFSVKVEGFEWTFPPSGWTNSGWSRSSVDKHSGTYSACSARTTAGTDYIYKTFTIDVGGGSVTFWWKASLNSTSYLRFMDGSEVTRCASTSWVAYTYSLSEGSHTLRWECVRGAAGAITAYLDDIVVTNTGKAIHLKSEGGAASCIIDCTGSGSTLRRGFHFYSGEGAHSVVEGFTVKNAYSDNGGGGAIACNSASPTITNCTITTSESTDDGGGIFCYNSTSEIRNCTVSSNTAVDSGGGIYCGFSSTVKIIGCTIQGNTTTATTSLGGGIYSLQSSPKITNCAVTSNSAGYWGAGIYSEDSTPSITGCTITNNPSGDTGGGIFIVGYSPSKIADCTISGNSAPYWGGGIYCQSSSSSITNCTISGNSAGDIAGGIYVSTGSSPTIYRCIIKDNTATTIAGGIECDQICNPAIINCTVTNNSAGRGGGIDFYSASRPTITNCTIANNNATSGNGGGFYISSTSRPTLNNCILWGNMASSLGRQIYTWNAGSGAILNYCDYADNTVNANNIVGPGTVTANNCIVSDPLFVDSANKNYRLLVTSPCIDVGNNSYVPSWVTIDLDGNPRIAKGIVDAGAYEFRTRFFTVNSQYGGPTPAAGLHEYYYQSTVTANCGPTPYSGGTGIQYVYTGHTGTGNVTNGPETSISFTITLDSSVTWLWQTQYYLTVVSGYGAPTGAGWYNAGSTAHWSVTSPWAGGTGIQYITSPTSGDVLMDSPKTVTVSWTTQYYLTVTSAYDTPVGAGWYDSGTTAHWSVTSPVSGGTGTQYVASPAAGDVTMDAPQTVTVVWITQYYLTVVSAYGNPQGEGWYNAGSTAHWSVTSPWSGGTGIQYVASPAAGDVVMDSPKTLTVTWTTQYHLTIDSLYGAPVGAGWYDSGATANWSVTSPYAGGTGVQYIATPPTSGSVVMSSPQTVTMTWTTQYKLTTAVNPSEGGSVTPSGETWHDENSVVDLTATANSGYLFSSWSGDTVTNPDAPDTPETVQITMTSAKSVTANFIPAIYVDGANGDDANNGLSWATAKKTIQAGLGAAGTSGWTVLVANGTYTGTGNKDLDFSGKAIHLKSVGGAANCIIDCENSGRGFYFHSGETAFAVIEGFTIRNGNAGDGGGIYCYNSSPTITNCTFSGNTASNGGGGMCNDNSSPTVTNCTFSANTATNYGGGMENAWSSSPTVTNCTFSANTADYGGGVYCGYSSPTFQNSIIWGNTAGTAGHQIYTEDSNSSVTLSYSCYANGANDVAGAGQVNSDNCINDGPEFVGGGDYHLQGTSPCIDIGNNSYVPGGVTTDLDGNPRIANTTVDQGAYEYQP